jgi:predicted PurR-regulated permease PerM
MRHGFARKQQAAFAESIFVTASPRTLALGSDWFALPRQNHGWRVSSETIEHVSELGASRALYRGALFLLVIFVLALILHDLIWVLIQVFVASIIAAAMTPIVDSLVHSRGIRRLPREPSRGLVVVVVFVAAAVITLLLGFLITRAIVQEIAALLEALPQYAAAFKDWLASVVSAYPGVVDTDLQTWISVNAQAVLGGLPAVLTGVLAFVGFATSVLGGFITVILTVFMALYLTIDAPRMRDYLVVFWPRDRQPRVSRLANEMGARLGHWAIGQAVLCVIVGGGAWLGLQLIGVPYAALLGLVWALAEFVPGIGPFLSAIPTILVGFAASPTLGVAAALFSLAWSQVESNVITPKVMGSAVELHPLVILIALIVGAELLGGAGALLAIPVAATVAVVIDEIRLERMRDQMERASIGGSVAV